MTTSFTKSVLNEMTRIGRGVPEVISESQDMEHFGDAHVTLDFEDLRLHVSNDRGVVTLEIGLNIVDPRSLATQPVMLGFKDGIGRPTCPLEVLAVAHGWIALDALVNHYDLDSEHIESLKDPENIVTQPFYSLRDALSLLEDGDKWSAMVASSNDHKLQLEAGKIELELQKRFAATLSD